MKIKLFTDSSIWHLEEEVNKFLDTIDSSSVRDIVFTTSSNANAYSIMVTYGSSYSR